MTHDQYLVFFFFNDTATTEIYTLSLHDALPISAGAPVYLRCRADGPGQADLHASVEPMPRILRRRSEEHTSELQSPCNLVCRLLLEKKKTQRIVLRHSSTNHLHSNTCRSAPSSP